MALRPWILPATFLLCTEGGARSPQQPLPTPGRFPGLQALMVDGLACHPQETWLVESPSGTVQEGRTGEGTWEPQGSGGETGQGDAGGLKGSPKSRLHISGVPMERRHTQTDRESISVRVGLRNECEILKNSLKMFLNVGSYGLSVRQAPCSRSFHGHCLFAVTVNCGGTRDCVCA